MFVDHSKQELTLQTESTKGLNPTNFIFALDESGSMSGDCWNTLMSSMKQMVATISNSNRLKNQFISIFKFNGSVTP